MAVIFEITVGQHDKQVHVGDLVTGPNDSDRWYEVTNPNAFPREGDDGGIGVRAGVGSGVIYIKGVQLKVDCPHDT